MPKVSVLVPTYKPNAEYLEAVMKCLFEQTYTDWECIVCDEPTDTDTKSLLGAYLEDPRVSYYRNETPLGIGPNWNRCFSKVSGEYIQYLFQDDLWYPNYLEESVKVLDQNPDVGFTAAYHDYKYEDEVENEHMYEGIQSLRRKIAGQTHNGQEFLNMWLKRGLHPNIIGEPPFVMMRKEHMDTVGIFNNDLPQFLDSEYWAKLLQITNFHFIKESLGAFRVHNEAASAQNQRAGKGLTDRLQTIEMLSKKGNAQTKAAAKACLTEVLPRMMRKYLDRKQDGKPVPGIAGGGMKQFIVRNPWLTLTSLIKAHKNKALYRKEIEKFERGEVR